MCTVTQKETSKSEDKKVIPKIPEEYTVKPNLITSPVYIFEYNYILHFESVTTLGNFLFFLTYASLSIKNFLNVHVSVSYCFSHVI